MTIQNLTILTLNEPNITDFAAARNRLMATVKTDWVFFLDADETLSPELEAEITQTLQTDQLKSLKLKAYSLPRRDFFLGRELKHGENAHNRFIRLIRKDSGVWQRPCHEMWVTEGRVGELKSPLLHTLPDIATLLDKINRYSTTEANFRYQQGRRATLLHLFIYPFAKFQLNYFWRRGFMDGVAGMIMAGLMSFHSFLTWTKLFLLSNADL